MLGAAADLLRSKPELVAENAFLRQQLIVLTRSTPRPRITQADRALLVLLASRARARRQERTRLASRTRSGRAR